jgi:hypothetical protein
MSSTVLKPMLALPMKASGSSAVLSNTVLWLDRQTISGETV